MSSVLQYSRRKVVSMVNQEMFRQDRGSLALDYYSWRTNEHEPDAGKCHLVRIVQLMRTRPRPYEKCVSRALRMLIFRDVLALCEIALKGQRFCGSADIERQK